nr:transthyretin isoform X2 [Bubalus bubalis]
MPVCSDLSLPSFLHSLHPTLSVCRVPAPWGSRVRGGPLHFRPEEPPYPPQVCALRSLCWPPQPPPRRPLGPSGPQVSRHELWGRPAAADTPATRGLSGGTASYQGVWTQGLPHKRIPAPLVAQGRGMEPGSSPLTTHVLDTASGLPAQGLYLRLSRLEDCGQQWTELKKSCTDRDGRCPGLLPPGQMKAGTYKLSFDTKGYWQKRGQESFYPYVEVVFTITNETHKFHVPLLLSPWSYTTYRGS